MVRVRAEKKNLELVLAWSPGTPRSIRTDAANVRQVLINLLSNAVKYTDKGAVTLRVKAMDPDESQRLLLTFEVEDTGRGISMEDQARIFEAYARVGDTSSQKGTGLGLAITRQLVELMRGKVAVESTPGRGSKFRVEMPVVLASESEVAAPTLNQGLVIGLEPGQPEYRVLVCDDQPANSKMLHRLLERVGFHLRVAEDGAQAVEIFQTWRPHFVWMDMRMPVMNGDEAAKRIRALEGGRDVKIAAVTASSFDEQRSEVLAAGFDDFIRKPFPLAEVFECMARHLGVRYLRREAPPARTGSPAAGLRPNDFAELPDGLRDELESALISLDHRRIAEVIERVSQRDAGLGISLTRYADRFAYTTILRPLQECRSK